MNRMNNENLPAEQGPEAWSKDNILIDHKYRLSPLVQIPMIGNRLISCIFLIGIVAIFGLDIPNDFLKVYLVSPSIVWLVGVAYLLWPLLAYRFWGFQLRKYDIIVKSGVLFQREVSIPWSRIQQVDSKANPFDRVCGLKRLVLHSAGSRAGRTSIPGIPMELADALQSHLANIVEKFHGSRSSRLAKYKEYKKIRTNIEHALDKSDNLN
jgi:membrane protein YdbS with pleckstrin-like domain